MDKKNMAYQYRTVVDLTRAQCMWDASDFLDFYALVQVSTMSSTDYKRPDVFEVANAAICAAQTCCWGAGSFGWLGGKYELWLLPAFHSYFIQV